MKQALSELQEQVKKLLADRATSSWEKKLLKSISARLGQNKEPSSKQLEALSDIIIKHQQVQ